MKVQLERRVAHGERVAIRKRPGGRDRLDVGLEDLQVQTIADQLFIELLRLNRARIELGKLLLRLGDSLAVDLDQPLAVRSPRRQYPGQPSRGR